MPLLLEIAVFNIESAIIAAASGADRIELCENPLEGGTTASYGMLKMAREKIGIPVFPIIRPRGGDFLYSDEEFDVMKNDILLCKQLGFEGVVIGMLSKSGAIDVLRTNRLVELAYPLEVTFHRAFDRAKDPFKSLEDIIACGCQRMLTSGQMPFVFDGKELIKQLINAADTRIIIMPGSGVRSNNITQLTDYTGAQEIHSSARKMIFSPMEFAQKSMDEVQGKLIADRKEIEVMKAKCKLF